ncbi:MAG: SDH family Clp fold serine proteinase [Actinomycetota bacterium]
MGYISNIIWLIILLSTIQPLLQQRALLARRLREIHSLEKKRHSRVITLIHRQEGFSFFGLPFARYIDIDDSEAILRAIELTDPSIPIDMIIHTPGGLVLAAEQIATALMRHRAPVTVMVPHYAMSGGTLIALGADRILMAPSAVLGPVDPQIGQWAAASILDAVQRKDVNKVDDETLILADIARKSLGQVRDAVTELLVGNGMPEDSAETLATTLSEGRWTHDFPITATIARDLGLNVLAELPDECREIMALYPQQRGRRPAVEYVPVPYGRRPSRAATGDGGN